MCSVGAVGMGLAMGSTAASIFQNKQNTEAQAEYAQRVSDANARLIKEQGRLSQNQLRKQQAQEHQATSLQLQELKKRAEIARAKARVAAAETGTTGLSVDALNAEYLRQEAESVRNLYLNQQFRDDQHEATAERIRIGQAVNLLSNQPAPYTLPSFLGASLRIGAAGFNAWKMGQISDSGDPNI